MYAFPHDVAYLSTTKLGFINLPGLLSHGKRDRTARVPGFVAIQLGERCFLVFLREGEPFHAARVEPSSRGPEAISAVLRTASRESERGEGGQIAYYGASEEQLLAMLATLLNEPVELEGVDDPRQPEQLFPALRERRFSGVLELSDGGQIHYLCFEEGRYRSAFLATTGAEAPAKEVVRTLFETGRDSLRLALYPPCAELPMQAVPGLVDLYRRVIGGVMNELGGVMGGEAGGAVMRAAQSACAVHAPVIAEFVLSAEGRVHGDPVASPRELTRAVAAWVTEALVRAAEQAALDPAATLARITRDARFVLEEHDFFLHLPWTVSF